jgi:hypothetical protein
MTDKNSEVKMSVIKDKTVPWPIKGYHLLGSYKLQVRLMWAVEEYTAHLNPEVLAFLKDPR